MAIFFSTLASLTIIVVYLSYFSAVRRGDATPNPSTWIIWAVVNILNSASFIATVNNVWDGLITIVVSISALLIFLYSLNQGKFSKVGIVEVIAVIIAVGTGVFWKVTGDARIANLALQFVFAISYIPTLFGIAKGDAREYPLPWILAVLAFIFASVAILINWDGDPAKLAYPAINGILGNGSVAILSIIKRSKV